MSFTEADFEHVISHSVEQGIPALAKLAHVQLKNASGLEAFKARVLGDQHYYLPSYPSPPDDLRRNWVEIPPFLVAVLITTEALCLPRFVIARWNLVVKLAYKGLLWVGAAQVDPGYVGHLSCPIYNLSDKHVRLDEGDYIALVDFVITTPFPYEGCTERKKWTHQPLTDKPLLEDYVPEGLRRALFTDAAELVNTVESRVGAFNRRTAFALK